MAASTRATTKPQKKRPSETGTPVQVRLQPDLLAQLDSWRRDQPDLPSRPDALRRIFREWLVAQGRLKQAPLDPADITEKIAELDAKAAALKHDGTPSPANALKTMKRAVMKNEATKLRNKLEKAKDR